MKRGNCYITCEAIYHLINGRNNGWKPMYIYHKNDTHWFLKHKSGIILDPTVSQFKSKPNYKNAVGCGFLTKKPSKRAQKLMEQLVWQYE